MEKLFSLVGNGFRRVFVRLTAVICTVLSVMGMSGPEVAFSDIRFNLALSQEDVTWINTAYSFAIIFMIPFCSGFSKKFGRRGYLSISVIIFTIASFFCGNATGFYELVICRFLQGIGGSGMLILSHIIITESWPVEKRATSQAFFLSGLTVAGILSPVFAGYITDNYSWPFIFFVNIPGGIVACLLVLLLVKNGSDRTKEDWLHTITLAVGASGLHLWLAMGECYGWFNSLFVIAVVLLVLAGLTFFARRHATDKSQSDATAYLRNENLRSGLILSFVITFGIGGSSFIMTTLPGLAAQLPINPLWASVTVLTVILWTAATHIDTGKALKSLIVIGLLFFCLFIFILFRISPAAMSAVDLIGILMLRGVAIALLSVSGNTLTLSTLEPEQMGQGIAINNVIKQLGLALGIALSSFHTI